MSDVTQNGQGAVAPSRNDDESTVRIRLGGKEWPVPVFVWAEQKVLMPMMRRVAQVNWKEVTDADMEAAGKLLFTVLKIGTPSLTQDAFDLLPISVKQISANILAIAKQADMEIFNQGEPEAQPASPLGMS
jgi:hypothetical protein